MRTIARPLTLLMIALGALTSLVAAQNAAPTPQTQNQAALMRNWSLFYEYQKNGEFTTAAPYGWNVIKLDPKRFKAVYSKLAECYFSFYQNDSSANRTAYADTMLIIYDLGIEHVPERAAAFWLSKAYALENYFTGRDLEAIKAYETALTLDFEGTDMTYIDRLGMLYVKNADKDPTFKRKAIDLYRKAHERFPDNPLPVERLKQLVTDPLEMVKIAEEDLNRNPGNEEKMWYAATANRDAERWGRAEELLQALVKKSPKNGTYWNELARVQQRAGEYRQAIGSYETAMKLNPALRENSLNIIVCYRQLHNYPAAKSYAMRTLQREKNWGEPYMELAEVYKASVEQCVKETKGGNWEKLDIDDKLVYKLAADCYNTAKKIQPDLANVASQRIAELSNLLPTREDIFFNKDRLKDGKMVIKAPCYSWIDEAVPVQSLQ